MKYFIVFILILFLSSNLQAQGEEVHQKHSVLFYPTRLLNFYFPTVSLGYQYYPKSNWSGGVTLGLATDHSSSQLSKSDHSGGFDVGIEGRYRLGGIEYRPWGVFLGLEASRAYASRPYGLEQTEIEGVSRIIDTRVVARREELNAGMSKIWRFESGLTLDVRVGMGVNAWSWTVTDKNIEAAPIVFSYNDEDEYHSLEGQANEHSIYVAPRIRIGLGWSF